METRDTACGTVEINVLQMPYLKDMITNKFELTIPLFVLKHIMILCAALKFVGMVRFILVI